MKTPKISSLPLFTLSLLFAFGCSTSQTTHTDTNTVTDDLGRDPAAVHTDVTPFNGLGTQLELKPGQSFLAFMMKTGKPAMDQYAKQIRAETKAINGQWSKLQGVLIQKHIGVAIRIDRNNYILNVGYLDGSDKNDIKSGRSYGIGPTGRESDPSDIFYLNELQQFYQKEPSEIGAFVEAIFGVLTNCDASGWSRLSQLGQTVATDFVAIYTAEIDRHMMVKLNPHQHPWEIDLGAATLVSIFDIGSGYIMKDGKVVKGDLRFWWDKGKVGSGIGETRRDRIALQHMIAGAAKKSETVQNIANLIGAPKAEDNTVDVIQNVFEFLSSPPGMKISGASAERLTKMMGQLAHELYTSGQNFAKSRG